MGSPRVYRMVGRKGNFCLVDGSLDGRLVTVTFVVEGEGHRQYVELKVTETDRHGENNIVNRLRTNSNSFLPDIHDRINMEEKFK